MSAKIKRCVFLKAPVYLTVVLSKMSVLKSVMVETHAPFSLREISALLIPPIHLVGQPATQFRIIVVMFLHPSFVMTTVVV